jgi:hypothetical protein
MLRPVFFKNGEYPISDWLAAPLSLAEPLKIDDRLGTNGWVQPSSASSTSSTTSQR